MTAPVLEGTLLERCNAIWEATVAQEKRETLCRLEPPLVRLWDGEWHWQGEVAAEYMGNFEWKDNDTGSGVIEIPFDHYTARWIWDEKGRMARGEKRNVHITVDKNGARWSGRLEDVTVDNREDGSVVLVARFLHDYENLKWYQIWSNAFLPAAVQFPRVFMLAGGARWALLTSLFLQVMREQTSAWHLPDDPLQKATWSSGGLDMSNWSVAVQPHSFMDDLNEGILWGLVISRWQTWHDVAKPILEDAELSVVPRRYLEGDPPPWPGANLRHGCLVIDIVDKSGYYTGTANGGNQWDGLQRTIANFTSDFIDSTESLISDTNMPSEYSQPDFKSTNKIAPYVSYLMGDETGIQTSKFTRIPAKGIQVNCGGHSMPGVNELISATVQMVGDLTAMIPGVPPMGGVADAVLKPIYTDTLLAWMSVKSNQRAVNSGWSRYFEYFQDGADKAYTLSSLMVLRQGFWATRSRFAHEVAILDGSPWLIGDRGQGHLWLSDRMSAQITGDWTGDLYVDRVRSIVLAWDENSPAEWVPVIGDNSVLKDPAQRAMEQLEKAMTGLSMLGVF